MVPPQAADQRSGDSLTRSGKVLRPGVLVVELRQDGGRGRARGRGRGWQLVGRKVGRPAVVCPAVGPVVAVGGRGAERRGEPVGGGRRRGGGGRIMRGRAGRVTRHGVNVGAPDQTCKV